jgi:pilus assembly protein CpaF
MANESETPKFPPPIPNPLRQPSTATATPRPRANVVPSARNNAPQPITEEEKTDPGLVSETTEKPAPARPLNARMPEMGLIDPLMKDPEISEIMVNDLRNVMIEKGGRLAYSGITYTAIDELNRLTRNILDITGRILSPDSPYVDTMLPDGSRVNIVGPPLTLYGPCITIRKFPERRLTVQDLIAAGTLDQKMGHFLQASVVGKLNILVSGGTGSGKTTLLNRL